LQTPICEANLTVNQNFENDSSQWFQRLFNSNVRRLSSMENNNSNASNSLKQSITSDEIISANKKISGTSDLLQDVNVTENLEFHSSVC